MTPSTSRGRWLLLSTFARMDVGSSGGRGPGCAPYEHVLQLLFEPRMKDHESWTVYRNREDARKAGKIVFKKWDIKADWQKIQKLDGKPLRKDWHEDNSVIEKQFPVSSLWIRNLERAIDELLIPPLAGTFDPTYGRLDHKLSLWRGRQDAKFSWTQKPPPAWEPLNRFFSTLWALLDKHADGEPLASLKS